MPRVAKPIKYRGKIIKRVDTKTWAIYEENGERFMFNHVYKSPIFYSAKSAKEYLDAVFND